MKHILLFNDDAEYRASKATLAKPYVCYTKEEGNVYYQENDNIEFVDSAAKTIMLSIFDTNSDGEITKEEALSSMQLPATSPFKNNQEITDMSFLKYFPNVVFPLNAENYFGGMINCKQFNLSGIVFRTNLAKFFATARACTKIILRNCDFSACTRVPNMFYGSQMQPSITIDFTGAILPSFSSIALATNFIGGTSTTKYTFIADKCSTDTLNTIEKLCEGCPDYVGNVTIVYNGTNLVYQNSEWVEAE